MSTKRCDACGREGARGFWTQVRMYPEPNRTLCTNVHACEKRRRDMIVRRPGPVATVERLRRRVVENDWSSDALRDTLGQGRVGDFRG
jgi:hypothetical protein